jgi:hypothetical protein
MTPGKCGDAGAESDGSAKFLMVPRVEVQVCSPNTNTTL